MPKTPMPSTQLSLFDPPPAKGEPKPKAAQDDATRGSRPTPEQSDAPQAETSQELPPEMTSEASGGEAASDKPGDSGTVATDGMEDEIADLEASLAEQTGEAWTVHLHHNRRTMISFNRTSLRLRLHQDFLDAPDGVISAIADKLSGRVKAWPDVVGHFINEFIDIPEFEQPAPDQAMLPTRGQVVDLRLVFQRLNERYFQGKLDCLVRWGQMGTPRWGSRTQRLILGSYLRQHNMIRIHPLLDHKRVPKQVVEAVMYHEMCHAVIGDESQGGRRVLHGPKFKKELARYPHNERADAWINDHMDWLLRRRKAISFR